MIYPVYIPPFPPTQAYSLPSTSVRALGRIACLRLLATSHRRACLGVLPAGIYMLAAFPLVCARVFGHMSPSTGMCALVSLHILAILFPMCAYLAKQIETFGNARP